jgi:hypothetical protein
VLNSQLQAEQMGRLALSVIQSIDKFSKDPSFVGHQRTHNMQKLEESAVGYARRAFSYASKFLDIQEYRHGRMNKTFKVIRAA